jgi:hypothetical protein
VLQGYDGLVVDPANFRVEGNDRFIQRLTLVWHGAKDVILVWDRDKGVFELEGIGYMCL